MLETMDYLTNGSVAGLLLLCSISATADNQNPEPAPKVIVKKFETIESTIGAVGSKVAAQLRRYGIDLDNMEAKLETLNADGRRIVIMHSDEDSVSSSLATKIFSDTLEVHSQTAQSTLSENAADCVLARLAKMLTSSAVTLLREACKARHPD